MSVSDVSNCDGLSSVIKFQFPGKGGKIYTLPLNLERLEKPKLLVRNKHNVFNYNNFSFVQVRFPKLRRFSQTGSF